MEITGAQIRSARGLLNWSAARVAKEANVSLRSVQRFEAAGGAGLLKVVRAAIISAIERGGIEFGPNESVARAQP